MTILISELEIHPFNLAVRRLSVYDIQICKSELLFEQGQYRITIDYEHEYLLIFLGRFLEQELHK
jgi:hypothetical protein